jgi:hypothetical protein
MSKESASAATSDAAAQLAAARELLAAGSYAQAAATLAELLRRPNLPGAITAAARELHLRAESEAQREADVVAALDAVSAAWVAGDSSKMLAELARVPLDHPNPQIATRRTELAQNLERLRTARGQVIAARSLLKHGDAASALRELEAAIGSGALPVSLTTEIRELMREAQAQNAEAHTAQLEAVRAALAEAQNDFAAGAIDEAADRLERSVFTFADLPADVQANARQLRAACRRAHVIRAELQVLATAVASGRHDTVLPSLEAMDLSGLPLALSDEAARLRAECVAHETARREAARQQATDAIERCSARLDAGETHGVAEDLANLARHPGLEPALGARLTELQKQLAEMPLLDQTLTEAEARAESDPHGAARSLERLPAELPTWAARRRVALLEQLREAEADRLRIAQERVAEVLSTVPGALVSGQLEAARLALAEVRDMLVPGSELAERHASLMAEYTRQEQWEQKVADVKRGLERGQYDAVISNATTLLTKSPPEFWGQALARCRLEAERRIAEKREQLSRQLRSFEAQVAARGRRMRNLDSRLESLTSDPYATHEHRRHARAILATYQSLPEPKTPMTINPAALAIGAVGVLAIGAAAFVLAWPNPPQWVGSLISWSDVGGSATTAEATGESAVDAPRSAPVALAPAPPVRESERLDPPAAVAAAAPEADPAAQAPRAEETEFPAMVESPTVVDPPAVADAASEDELTGSRTAFGDFDEPAAEVDVAALDTIPADAGIDAPGDDERDGVAGGTEAIVANLPAAAGAASPDDGLPFESTETQPPADVDTFESAVMAFQAAVAAQVGDDVAFDVRGPNEDGEFALFGVGRDGVALLSFEGLYFDAERGVITQPADAVAVWFATQADALHALANERIDAPAEWGGAPVAVDRPDQARFVRGADDALELHARIRIAEDRREGAGIDAVLEPAGERLRVGAESRTAAVEYVATLQTAQRAALLDELKRTLGVQPPLEIALETPPDNPDQLQIVLRGDGVRAVVSRAVWRPMSAAYMLPAALSHDDVVEALQVEDAAQAAAALSEKAGLPASKLIIQRRGNAVLARMLDDAQPRWIAEWDESANRYGQWRNAADLSPRAPIAGAPIASVETPTITPSPEPSATTPPVAEVADAGRDAADADDADDVAPVKEPADVAAPSPVANGKPEVKTDEADAAGAAPVAELTPLDIELSTLADAGKPPEWEAFAAALRKVTEHKLTRSGAEACGVAKALSEPGDGRTQILSLTRGLQRFLGRFAPDMSPTHCVEFVATPGAVYGLAWQTRTSGDDYINDVHSPRVWRVPAESLAAGLGDPAVGERVLGPALGEGAMRGSGGGSLVLVVSPDGPLWRLPPDEIAFEPRAAQGVRGVASGAAIGRWEDALPAEEGAIGKRPRAAIWCVPGVALRFRGDARTTPTLTSPAEGSHEAAELTFVRTARGLISAGPGRGAPQSLASLPAERVPAAAWHETADSTDHEWVVVLPDTE